MVVHDGARPCVSQEVISDVIKSARRGAASVSGCRIRDTVKIVEKGTTVSSTVDRAKYWAVQTPQAFNFRTLTNAYKNLGKNDVTDDCQAVELSGETVRIYENRAPNFKITTVEDLQIASAMLAK